MLGLLRTILVALLGVVATVYLINPTFGVFELLPDNAPLIGNLDEAAAAALLIACLSYFGIDLTKAFGRRRVKEEAEQSTDQ
ncbi:MAG: DUF1232 domain-containing protein [Planctomycetota bacterium]